MSNFSPKFLSQKDHYISENSSLIFLLQKIIIIVKTFPTRQKIYSLLLTVLPIFLLRASLKAMVILVPILGISWIFGIISINKEGVVYQYIFTVLSSTQVISRLFNLTCSSSKECTI